MNLQRRNDAQADNSTTTKVALVTGGARRLGAAMVRAFHARGIDIALHYNTSRAAAESLATELNEHRAHSVRLFPADLCEHEVSASLVQQVVSWRNRLDVLVNNASSFYPTPLEDASEVEWNDLMASNLKGTIFHHENSRAHAARLQRRRIEHGRHQRRTPCR